MYLIEDPNNKYTYNDVGNLIKKVSKTEHPKRFSLLADDDNNSLFITWQYQWYANGNLQKVYNNDGVNQEYQYDALGRRNAILKGNTIKRTIYDGNVPLHEFSYALKEKPKLIVDAKGILSYDKAEPVDNLVTWVFNEGTFVPQAKIVNGETYSIVTDYLGTPTEAYNAEGKKVWSSELDIYGKVAKFTGERSFIPFRYQGQYDDGDTGLYYNRFRYYSPDSGTYISQDPIGLLGSNQNFYAYTFDSNVWIDPLGLAIIPTVTTGPNGRVQTANATVTNADLGTGTNTNASSRAYARGLGDQTDDAGHMVGKQLGGSGGKKNVFPQDFHVNRGQFAQFEGQVADFVNTHGSANLKLEFEYGNGGTRPTKVTYTAESPNGKKLKADFDNFH